MIYGNNILSNTTILNEITIFKDTKYNISIHVDADGSSFRGYIYNPYFKIYDDINPKKSHNKTRISIKGTPQYIIHNNEIWILNSAERKRLNNYMNELVMNRKGQLVTVWDFIIESIIELSKSKITDKVLLNDIILELRSLSKPDFSVILQPEK